MKQRNIFIGIIVVVLVAAGILITQTDLLLGSFRIENTKTAAEILTDAKRESAASLKASVAKSLEKQQDTLYEKFLAMPKIMNSTFNVTADLNDGGSNGKVDAEVTIKSEVSTDALKTLDKNASLQQFIDVFQGKFTIGMNFDMKQKVTILEETEEMNMGFNIAGVIIANRGTLHMSLTKFEAPALPVPLPLDMTSILNKWYTINLNSIIKKNEIIAAMMKSSKLFNANHEKVTAVFNKYVDDVMMNTTFFAIEEASRKETRNGDVYTLTIGKPEAKEIVNKHIDFLINNFDAIIAMSRQGYESSIPGFAEADAAFKADLERDLGGLEEFLHGVIDDDEFATISVLATLNGDKLAKLAFNKPFDITEDLFTAKGSFDIALMMEDLEHNLEKSHLAMNFEVEGDDYYTPDEETGEKPLASQTKAKVSAVINKKKSDKRRTDIDLKVHSKEYLIGDKEPFGELSVKAGIEMLYDTETKKLHEFNGNLDAHGNPSTEEAINGVAGEISYKGGKVATLSGSFETQPKDDLSGVIKGTLKKADGNISITVQNKIADLQPLKTITASYNYKEEAGSPEIDLYAIKNAIDLTEMLESAVTGLLGGLENKPIE